MTAPLICLHGFTGAPETFAPLGLPIALSPYLAGHGPNPDFTTQTFREEVTRLAGAIEERLTTRGHLLGYSMGARVGLGLLLDYPHLFVSASLVGAQPGLSSESERRERLAADAQWIDLLETQGVDRFVERWAEQPVFSSQASLPVAVLEEQRRARRGHSQSGLCHALRVLGLGAMPNFWPRLGELEVPTTLLIGARDEKFGAIAQRAVTKSAYVECLVVPKAGHNPLLEAPELVRGHLQDFLAKDESDH
jgi:2-succinyl-6-hydroxy-2,4-cyclohexadiene-1-carboxylate synthase